MTKTEKFFAVWARFLAEDVAESAIIFLLLLLLLSFSMPTVIAALISTLLATAIISYVEVVSVA